MTLSMRYVSRICQEVGSSLVLARRYLFFAISSGQVGQDMTKIKDLHKSWMKDAAYRREYDALEEEFTVMAAIAKARRRAGLRWPRKSTPSFRGDA